MENDDLTCRETLDNTNEGSVTDREVVRVMAVTPMPEVQSRVLDSSEVTKMVTPPSLPGSDYVKLEITESFQTARKSLPSLGLDRSTSGKAVVLRQPTFAKRRLFATSQKTDNRYRGEQENKKEKELLNCLTQNRSVILMKSPTRNDSHCFVLFCYSASS